MIEAEPVLKLMIVALWTAFLGSGTVAILAQGQAPVLPGSDAQEFAAVQPANGISDLTLGTGVALLLVTVARAITEVYQWRTQRDEKDDKAEMVRDLAVLTANLESSRSDVSEWESRYRDEHERRERLEGRLAEVMDERDSLRIQLAMATGKEPPSSGRMDRVRLSPAPAGPDGDVSGGKHP